MPGFMRAEILRRQAGARVETAQGVYFIPSEVYGARQLVAPATLDAETVRPFVPYSFGPADVEPVTGWFGRYTAPGYLDSTEWHFNTSRTALEEELDELYGDDGGEAEEEEEAEE